MTHLLAMLRDAGVIQSMDWTLFQNTKKRSFFISNEGNSANTDVYVKWDHCIQKYSFSVAGTLVALTSETAECVPV
jgi:hypothetical protein